jgi:hypothetical protein
MKLSFMDTPAFDKLHRAVAFYGSAVAVAYLAAVFSLPTQPSVPALEKVGNLLCLTGVDTLALDSPIPAGCVTEPAASNSTGQLELRPHRR